MEVLLLVVVVFHHGLANLLRGEVVVGRSVAVGLLSLLLVAEVENLLVVSVVGLLVVKEVIVIIIIKGFILGFNSFGAIGLMDARRHQSLDLVGGSL
jgi:hypothetical protein